jgi:hypothetical protein
MAKIKRKLSEIEFQALVEKAVTGGRDETDGKVLSSVHDVIMRAHDDSLRNDAYPQYGISDSNIVRKEIYSYPKEADSLILPFKTKYLFHCHNLRGAAALLVFDLSELDELTPREATLKGNIVYNRVKLGGSIIVSLSDESVTFERIGNRSIRNLKIDPSKKEMWRKLIGELRKSAGPCKI